jgi:hypothetical protein
VKTYYLRLVQSDFSQDGNLWTSPVFDLYQNSSYTNFSTIKSKYGPDVLGNDTWVGLEYDYATDSSDTGAVVGGRYIDKSGRIDIPSYELTLNSVEGASSDVDYTLNIYTATEDSAATPHQWTAYTNAHRLVSQFDIYRYAYFEIQFDTDHTLTSADIELLIRVDIDRPVMSPLYARARPVMKKFPSWTEIWEDHVEPATPYSATPNSVGGGLINAAAGEWLEQINDDIDDFKVNRFITTADANMASHVYELEIPGVGAVWKVEGDGTVLSNCYNLDDFYNLDSTEDGYFWLKNRNVIYIRKEYTTISVNDETQYDTSSSTPIDFTLSERHVWNWFDEFGLFVDLFRLPSESNEIFRKRILDVYQNRPGTGNEAFKLALRRELDLWQSFGATPDLSFTGATPEVYDLSEVLDLVDGASPFMGYDNMPQSRLRELVRDINTNYPTTWGNFAWGRAAWDVGGKEGQGYSTLPYQFDATPTPASHFGVGIGDGDDLYVYRPDEKLNVEEFSLDFTARGHYKTTATEYPPTEVSLLVQGEGDYTAYANTAVTQWLSVQVITNDATPVTYYTNIEASAISTISANNHDNNRMVAYSIFNQDGLSRNELIWYDAAGTEFSGNEATPFQLDYSNITSMLLKAGQFDPGTQTIINTPTSNNFRAWLSEDSGGNVYPAGYSTDFDGSDDSIAISGQGNFGVNVGTNEYVTAWAVFNADDFSTSPRIMAAKNGTTALDDGWEVRVTTSGQVRGAIGDGVASVFVNSPVNIETGKKYLVCLVIDGSVGNEDATLYINNLSDTVSVSSLADCDSGHLNVLYGSGQNGAGAATNFFDGKIYACGTADRVFTEAEVFGLAAYYGVGHGSPEDAYTVFGDCEIQLRDLDLSGNDDEGNTITIAGGATHTQDEGVVDDSLVMQYDGVSATPDLTSNGPGAATPYISDIVYEPLTTSGTPASTWQSQPITINTVVNNVRPSTSPSSVTVNIPVNSIFPSAPDFILDNTPNKVLKVTLQSASSLDANGDPVTVADSDISVESSNSWTSSAQDLSAALTTMEIESAYSITGTVWNAFERTASNFISGTVDVNGPWRNSIPPQVGNSNYVLENVNIARTDFGIANSADFIVRWIGVTSNNDRINAWLDSNTVNPDIDEGNVSASYPSNAIAEAEDGGIYSYASFPIKVMMKPGPDKQWNPSMHSGFFYTEDEEYYLYANEEYEIATPGSNDHIMNAIARQGAPIIVRTQDSTPSNLRQVAFWDSSTPSLVSYNVETVNGSGTTKLFLAYENVYNVSITDITTGAAVSGDSSSSTNVVNTTPITDRNHEYQVTYRVRSSFYADNNHEYSDGSIRTKLVFDQSPTDLGVTNYDIWYEGNLYNTATPVSMPLHPFYTVLDEGFLFVSYNEYDIADSIEIRFSPSSIVADGEDYAIMTMRTYDVHGNPKPNQTFNLSTDFGSFDVGTGAALVASDAEFELNVGTTHPYDAQGKHVIERGEFVGGGIGAACISANVPTTRPFQLTPTLDTPANGDQELDIRFIVHSNDYTNGDQDIISKRNTASGQRVWMMNINSAAHPVVTWSSDGTTETNENFFGLTMVDGTAYAVRCLLDVANGTCDWEQHAVSDALAGDWSQTPILTEADTHALTTLNVDATVPISIGGSFSADPEVQSIRRWRFSVGDV